MIQNPRIAIIGGGSWATAIAKIISEKCVHLNWYIYEKEIIEHLKEQHHNPAYLSSVSFNTKKISFFNNIKEVFDQSDVIFFVVPSAYVKSLLDKSEINCENKFIVNAVKGIIPDENLTISQYFQHRFQVPSTHVGVVSGPSHAEEVSMERLTYLTVAAELDADAHFIEGLINTDYIKTIISKDIYGIEMGGVLKNIYALGIGICHGLGYGDNYTAVLSANALREMKRFLNKFFDKDRNLSHSVYLGDLLVTAYSQFSRNRTFGAMIGKGYSVKTAMVELSMVAEGYYAVKCVYEINKKLLAKMPIADAVYRILYEKASPAQEFKIISDKLK